MRISAVLFSTLLGLTGMTEAQVLVHPGDRVRATTRADPSRRIEGEVTLATADTIVLEVPDPKKTTAMGAPLPVTLAFARQDLQSLHIRRTGQSRTLLGLVVGGTAGFGLGVTLGLLAEGEEGGLFEYTTGDIVQSGLVLGASGAILGALIGAHEHSHTWEHVSLTRAGRDGGIRLGWRGRF